MKSNYQHSFKDKIDLIIKIQNIENYLWLSMIKDLKQGIDTVDYDSLLYRYNSSKKFYDIRKFYKDILDSYKDMFK